MMILSKNKTECNYIAWVLTQTAPHQYSIATVQTYRVEGIMQTNDDDDDDVDTFYYRSTHTSIRVTIALYTATNKLIVTGTKKK